MSPGESHCNPFFRCSSCSIQMLDKRRQVPTQFVTDACCIYRREIVQPSDAYAMIIRGREIAYEAAHSPAIPSSMPNYTHDQIRELYGEFDQKTRCLQDNEYLLHTPMIDAWQEKSAWLEECPLPKFRLEKHDPASLLSTYLSTGLSNNPCNQTYSNEKENIRGSFRTAIADRTTITPSPLVFNVQVDLKKVVPRSEIPSYIPEIVPSLAQISELMDIDSLIDLDEETIAPYATVKINSPPNEENLPIENLIRIVRAIHDFHFIYDETNDKDITNILPEHQTNEQIDLSASDFLYTKDNDDDDDDGFEDLYERYITKLDQYEAMLKRLDHLGQKTDVLTPISEESVTLMDPIPDNQLMKDRTNDELCSTITCQRQNDHIGHYGFELEETNEGKIRISSILNSNYCSDLKIGDELLAINHYSVFQTVEQCHRLLHSFWHRNYDYLQISVRTSKQPSKSTKNPFLSSHSKDYSINSLMYIFSFTTSVIAIKFSLMAIIHR